MSWYDWKFSNTDGDAYLAQQELRKSSNGILKDKYQYQLFQSPWEHYNYLWDTSYLSDQKRNNQAGIH